MPLRLLRSIDSNDPFSQQSTSAADNDERVESVASQSPLRPLTSDARPSDYRSSLTTMPSIYPASLSISSLTDATMPKQRRTAFLPQLSQAKSFASAQGDSMNGPQEDEDTEAFKQAMWAGQASILVTVRVRPHCSHDRDEREIVKVIDNKLIVVLDKQQNQPPPATTSPQHRASSIPSIDPLPVPLQIRRLHNQATGHGLRKLRNVASAHPSRVSSNNLNTSTGSSNLRNPSRSREKRYAFDYVFTPEDSQQTVYHHTTKFLIHGVLNGFNATVFAYGCTGAGKTYTMLGTPDAPGIMALTLDDLFHNIARVHNDPQATVVYRATVSFLEVYNENIRDLLTTTAPVASSPPPAEYLDLREDPVKGPVVAGISEVEASNAQDVMKLLRRGNKHRSQEATAANAVSSRSHAVLQVLVEQRDKTSTVASVGADGSMISTVKYGKLSLVDLAGSERAAVTQNRGQRLIEGANINRSLLALGNCINALGEKTALGSGQVFVPYRDSKLTRLLKDSLGGNCRTVMIANVSPAAASMEETLNTLKYANRAKNIKTTVSRNVLSVDHHLTEYASVVAELKEEIVVLKRQLARQVGGGGRGGGRGIKGGRGRVEEEEVVEEEEEVDHRREENRTQAKLKEARGYIVQCFEQRRQLKTSLLELDFCIAELAKRMTEEEREKGRGRRGAVKGEEELQRDLVASILEDLVEEDRGQQQETLAPTVGGRTLASGVDELEASVHQLLARKQRVVENLAWNQSVMDDFHVSIEQSPLFHTNELLRDVLLMEYRVGDLQVENAVLLVTQQLKTESLASVLRRLVAPTVGENADTSGSAIPSMELPPPSLTEMTRLLTASTAAPETHTTRGRAGFAFLDELRERFYRPTPTHDATNKSATTGAVSPRRQWGLHLNNTSLPYIRLKKKAPPQLAAIVPSQTSVVMPPIGVGDHQLSDANTRESASATAAASYLKVLKHRRKLHHRHSTNAKKLSS